MARDISRRTVVVGASALVGLAACGEVPGAHRRVSLRGATMGTTYAVTLVDPPPRAEPGALRAEIARVLSGIDVRMSTYRTDSEVSRFNALRATEWFSVSADTLAVIAAGLSTGRVSSGGFDITVGPAVDRWGFGPSGRRTAVRAVEQDRLRSLIDYRWIEASPTRGAIRKSHGNAAIDLSGIAKGFAVDRIAEFLTASGMANFLVEIGGEFRARGVNPSGKPWALGIEKPVADEIAIHRGIDLTAGALATSGDYRQCFARDGQRFSHIIDPRTGRPVTGHLASVSVVAGKAMTADALSTALMVLGPRKGWALARRERIAALFITRVHGGFADRATPEFARYLAAWEAT